MTFFQRNRQRLAQHQYPRRNGGFTAPQVVVHTYEAPPTTSALAGATYLLNRTNHGSYHWLSGAASVADNIHLAPWSHETWHSTPNNNWSVGVSCMAQAANWNSYSAAVRRNLVHGMALGAHRFSRWCVSMGKGAIPARRITRAQAMSKMAGFVAHGTMDPGRRSDPGATFPWDMFFAEYRRLEAAAGGGGGGTTPPKETTPVATPLQIWNERLTPDPLVTNNYNIREDGFRARYWLQSSWVYSRRAADARRTWAYVTPSTGRSMAQHLRRGDLSTARFTSRVSGNQISIATAVLNAQEKATNADTRTREILSTDKEILAAVEFLVNEIGSLKETVANIARTEAANVAAADVADQLKVVTKEGN